MPGNSKKKRKSAGTTKNMHSVLPVTIRHSESQDYRLKMISYNSLENFRHDTAVAQDWTNIYLRLQVGYKLAQNYYTAEAAEGVAAGILAARGILNRREATEKEGGEPTRRLWRATAGEIELILIALEVVDGMFEQCTRAELVKSQREAYADIGYDYKY